MGSTVGAGGSISATADSVSVIGAQEVHTYNSKSQESGLFSGSTDGFFSIWGKEKDKLSGTSVNNVGSLLTAGEDVVLSARETDVNVIGSQVGAGNDIVLNAARDVNILPGKESATSKESHENSGFGISYGAGNGSLSLGIGVNSTSDKISQGSKTNAMSTLSAGNDLVINAGRDANLQAADVSAEHDVAILATRDVNLLAANDVTNYKAVHEQMFVGVTATVSTGLISAADSIGDAAQSVANVSDGYTAANAAFAGLKAADALNHLAAVAAGKADIASLSVTAGFNYSKNETSSTVSTPVVTTVRGGNSVTIEAKSGSITGHGTQILAGYDAFGMVNEDASGDIKLKAKDDITFTSAQAVSDTSGNNVSAGANLGVGIGLGLGGLNAGPTGGANGSVGRNDANSVTQVNSHIFGTGTITIKSGDDATFAGAVVSGDKVKADVGGNLTVVSVPDTGNRSNSSVSGGVSLGGGLGGIISGVNVGGGIGSGNTNWISEQSGFFSSGEMDVKVGGNTHLGAAAIVSDSKDLSLDTGTLTWSDFEGEKKYEGVNANLGLNLSGDEGPLAGPKATLDGSYQLDDTRQIVRATVGEGTITIRDQEKQAALEDNGKTKPLAEINRDPDKAYEITKDKHVDIDFYLSDTSVKAAIDSGVAITKIIGGLLDYIGESKLARAIENKQLNAAEVLKQLNSGACAEQRGDSFDIWEWIVPSAYAASCVLTTVTGEKITVSDRDSCIVALAKVSLLQAVATANNPLFAKGLAKGAAGEAVEIVELLSDPRKLASDLTLLAAEIFSNPQAAAKKYGPEIVAGLEKDAYLYLQAMASGDFEAAGERLSGFAVTAAMAVLAPQIGLPYKSLTTAEKLAAFRKLTGGLPEKVPQIIFNRKIGVEFEQQIVSTLSPVGGKKT